MEELARAATNPEEIDIASSGEESEGEGEGRVVEEVQLEKQAVPSAVFGSIPEEKQTEVLQGKGGGALGARERFAMKKT